MSRSSTDGTNDGTSAPTGTATGTTGSTPGSTPGTTPGTPTRTETGAQRLEPGTRYAAREHGGMRVGAGFFGWLTATGMALLLTALLGAIGAVLSVTTGVDAQQATTQAAKQVDTIGLAGGIGLLVVVLVSYFCGGYVAGRMARFAGAKQGLAVWLWALLIAVVVAILGTIAGAKFDILSQLNGFPRIPVKQGDLATGGVIALVVVAVASLVAAVLGGLAGMRYHRKIDKTIDGR